MKAAWLGKLGVALGVLGLLLLAGCDTDQQRALRLLQEARQAESTLALEGRVQTQINRGGQTVVATATVKRWPGQSQITFLDGPAAGREIVRHSDRFWPGRSAQAGGPALEGLPRPEQMGQRYQVALGERAVIAGQPAIQVTVQPRGQRSRAQINLWIDPRNGFVLARERRDPRGNVVMSTRYLEVKYGTPDEAPPVAPRVAQAPAGSPAASTPNTGAAGAAGAAPSTSPWGTPPTAPRADRGPATPQGAAPGQPWSGGSATTPGAGKPRADTGPPRADNGAPRWGKPGTAGSGSSGEQAQQEWRDKVREWYRQHPEAAKRHGLPGAAGNPGGPVADRGASAYYHKYGHQPGQKPYAPHRQPAPGATAPPAVSPWGAPSAAPAPGGKQILSVDDLRRALGISFQLPTWMCAGFQFRGAMLTQEGGQAAGIIRYSDGVQYVNVLVTRKPANRDLSRDASGPGRAMIVRPGQGGCAMAARGDTLYLVSGHVSEEDLYRVAASIP